MYKDIEALIDEYVFFADAIPVAEFSATSADGELKFYSEFVLYGLQNKNGNIVDYAVEHYHTGLNPGCFGVRDVYLIPDLACWNGLKQFYKNMGIK